MEYLKCHPSAYEEDVTNTERGIMRKISSLRSFYNYFYRNERIEKNPAALVQLPKLHEKEIIRLEVDEVAKLLDLVEDGEKLTERQKKYHQLTKTRESGTALSSSGHGNPCIRMCGTEFKRCGYGKLRCPGIP